MTIACSPLRCTTAFHAAHPSSARTFSRRCHPPLAPTQPDCGHETTYVGLSSPTLFLNYLSMWY